MNVSRLFIDCSIRKLEQQADRIRVCLGQLNEAQIWRRTGEHENAIGNLVLHLAGNVRQWILTGLGGAPDHRVRDVEFSTRQGPSSQELADAMLRAVEEAAALLPSLTEEQLSRTYQIQNYHVSGVEMVLHVVEHFSYHAGQIIFATKAMTGADPAFYQHLNAPRHNEKTP